VNEEQRRFNDRANCEFDLIWRAAVDSPGVVYEARVLAGQIEDVELLRELLAMFVGSASLWHAENEKLRGEAQR
jgi:hypothetical protein